MVRQRFRQSSDSSPTELSDRGPTESDRGPTASDRSDSSDSQGSEFNAEEGSGAWRVYLD